MSVLYINEYGASVGVSNERVQIRREGKVVKEMPALHVERIVLMVPANITTPAVRFFMQNGVTIAYVSQNGKFYGQFAPGDGGFVKLRLAQYEKFKDNRFRLKFSKKVVAGKIQQMQEFWRRQRSDEAVKSGLERMESIAKNVKFASSLDALRGFEGSATATHFAVLRGRLKGEWKFQRRIQRPAPDPINAMLNLGYTLLYSRMSGLLHVQGLDPYLGFFHEPKRNHAALASDLIEEWRTPVVDALIVRLINTKRISPKEFNKSGGRCTMQKPTLQRYVTAFEQQIRKLENLPANGGDPVGGMEGQVRQLARLLMNKDKAYVPILAES